MADPFRIRSLTPAEAHSAVGALADVLLDCVAGGASVSFMADLTFADAQAFWLAATTADDGRAILVAQDHAGIFGVVQVIPMWAPNQPHRVDIAKLLVSRRARGRGAAQALMAAAEAATVAMGRTLMTLDTVTGGAAERLYAKLGWTRSGEIPGYALMPDGALCGTTIFYKSVGEV